MSEVRDFASLYFHLEATSLQPLTASLKTAERWEISVFVSAPSKGSQKESVVLRIHLLYSSTGQQRQLARSLASLKLPLFFNGLFGTAGYG